MFLLSWSVSMFVMGFSAAVQQIEWEEYSKRVGKSKTYVQKICYIPLCTILPQQHPIHFHGDITHVMWETNRQTDVVQWVNSWSARCLSGDITGTLWALGGDGFPGKLCEGHGMADDHAVGWGKKGQLEENSRYSSPVQGSCVLLGTDWFSSWSGSGVEWGPEFSECPSSTPPFSLGRSEDKSFFLLFSLLSWWVSFVFLDML